MNRSTTIKILLVIAIIFSGKISANDSKSPMILEFDTTLNTYYDEVFISFSGNVDLLIDWGDGNTTTMDEAGETSHTYEVDGVHTVTITGSADYFGSGDGAVSLLKLTKVISYGDLGLKGLWATFTGSTYLNEIPETFPESITSLLSPFPPNGEFIPDVSSWDVSNITEMVALFSGMSSFNQDISDWNVSNVTNISSIFSGATSFQSRY